MEYQLIKESMTNNIPIEQLRRKILKTKDIILEKGTRKPIRIEDLPDEYPKTAQMKYLETKYQLHLEKIIFKGSLSDVERVLHYEIDRSTVSRWRAHIRKHLGLIIYSD